MARKILYINTFFGGSTGTLCQRLFSSCPANGYEAFFASNDMPKEDVHHFRIGRNLLRGEFDRFFCKLDGSDGFRSSKNTFDLCKWIDTIKPDIIHLNNCHGHYLSLPILLDYIKKHDCSLVITMHDCWFFTGKCPHFEIYHCQKWHNQCRGCCPSSFDYPRSLLWPFQHAKFLKKRNLLLSLSKQKTVFISPSFWLDQYFSQSFLSDFSHHVIHNGVDENIFFPREDDSFSSPIRILGVAYPWSRKKGLDVFNRLAKDLDPSLFQISLVGLSKRDKTNPLIHRFPKMSPEQLSEIYRSSDIFVNASLWDNYPTVVLEAVASGLLVATFSTGGSAESLSEFNSIVVDKGDYENLKKAVLDLSKRNCIFKEKGRDTVSINLTVANYMSLYRGLLAYKQ